MTPQLSLEMAEQTALAYEDPNFYAGNVQARIIARAGITRIGVAGSNDPKDFCEDGMGFLVPRAGRGRLFKGFADMGDESKDAFLKFIEPFLHFSNDIEIGGHSAGSPVALQWAGWLGEMGIHPRLVQLLAAPMLWDAEGATYYQKFQIPTVRVAMLHDPVPTLPGVALGGVYESPTIVLDRAGVVYPAQDVDPCLDLIGRGIEINKNHGCAPNYVRGIRCYLRAG